MTIFLSFRFFFFLKIDLTSFDLGILGILVLLKGAISAFSNIFDLPEGGT